MQVSGQSTCDYLWERDPKGHIQARRALFKKLWEHCWDPKRKPLSGRQIRCHLRIRQRHEGEAKSEHGNQRISFQTFQKRVCTDLDRPGSEDSEQAVPFSNPQPLSPSLPNTRLGAADLPSSDFPLVTLDLLTVPLDNSHPHCPTHQQLSLMYRSWNTVSNHDSWYLVSCSCSCSECL